MTFPFLDCQVELGPRLAGMTDNQSGIAPAEAGVLGNICRVSLIITSRFVTALQGYCYGCDLLLSGACGSWNQYPHHIQAQGALVCGGRDKG